MFFLRQGYTPNAQTFDGFLTHFAQDHLQSRLAASAGLPTCPIQGQTPREEASMPAPDSTGKHLHEGDAQVPRTQGLSSASDPGATIAPPTADSKRERTIATVEPNEQWSTTTEKSNSSGGRDGIAGGGEGKVYDDLAALRHALVLAEARASAAEASRLSEEIARCDAETRARELESRVAELEKRLVGNGATQTL